MSVAPSEIKHEMEQLHHEIAEKQRHLAQLKRVMGEKDVDDYELTASDGRAVRLSEMFGDRDEMIVIHNMGSGCAYCTLWADGFNGVVPHLESRAAFVVVSPDAPERQREFAASRGWRFTMLSTQGSTFTEDLGFKTTEGEKSYYMPGVSTLKKQPDGTIVRTASDSFGPGDNYCGVFHLFDLLSDGGKGWSPKLAY